MTWDDPYATVERYVADAEKSGAGDNATILLQLTGISRVIEFRAGQVFNIDAAVTSRVYCPSKTTTSLIVDNIGSTTGFEIKVDEDDDGSFIDETAWESTDYELRPLNAAKHPEPRPWWEILVPSWSTRSSFAAGHRVQVTALHGWPAVPNAVMDWCVELTRILRLESPRATSRITEFNQVLGASRAAQNILSAIEDAYHVPRFG